MDAKSRSVVAIAAAVGVALCAASCGGETSDDATAGGSSGASGSAGSGGQGAAGGLGGASGVGAASGASASGGAAPCVGSMADCNNDPSDGCESDLSNDWAHCGACGAYCWASTCIDGECPWECAAGWIDCDGKKPWCETDSFNDPSNCGECGQVCDAGAGPVFCAAGLCVASCGCEPPYIDCNGTCVDGCETNPETDSKNCGACGTACSVGQACVAAACACAPGRADCNADATDGCEVELTSDAMNCGACGNACAPGMTCVSAICG